ncbi:phosphoglucosamine mutase [Lacibacter sediminis]|uniref:Phosphoglucosamine mutase n=1 Tax=Lacibacter sediminis TaxID=2760713 RepID=A0A7G5XBG5_9BACT|nr:phosphoglucosamine mutase [Lacibacter sediminis]QNA42818.1 phosphoglucosamine mutase [Lacibacter sediminis]
MALMKSISGIRGTIGGAPGDNLTPVDIVKFTAAYATILGKGKKVIVGRDGRMSGEMVCSLVVNTLLGMGLHVIDLGLSTTPTVEMAVKFEGADGGIILTASHNPKQWNALKLLNEKGEFISAELGQQMLQIAEKEAFDFAGVDELGTYSADDTLLQTHIDAILVHPLVDKKIIAEKNFTVVIDAINSSGAVAVPALLEALGVTNYTVLHAEMHGNFAHNPEPLAENLVDLCTEVVKQKADLGIAVDPDVDRLCFVSDDGSLFGEEYTLVAVADYILSKQKGNTVSNLSSTRALKDVTEKHGGEYFASAVGEVNVVKMMKDVNAVIGGEGNGGIIDPQLHYGRDALIGIALFLTHLAQTGKTTAELRKTYPDYFMSKQKIDLPKETDVKALLAKVKDQYSAQPVNTVDGVKIDFDKSWVHLRSSNTEPIIRVYSEASTIEKADGLANEVMNVIKSLM